MPVMDQVLGYVVGVLAGLAYLAGALYGAVVEGTPYLCQLLTDGLKREAHPMPLKGFLFASITVLMIVMSWIVMGTIMCFHGHPFIAEAMNDSLTVVAIWFFGRTG